MHWQFGEMEFGEMKRNTSNWSNFGMLLRRAGLTASAGLSCWNMISCCYVPWPDEKFSWSTRPCYLPRWLGTPVDKFLKHFIPTQKQFNLE